MSNAFYPDFSTSGRPLTLEQIESVAIPDSSSVFVSADAYQGSTYDTSNLHLSGNNTSFSSILPGREGLNLVLFGCSIVSTAELAGDPDIFAGSLFEEDSDSDIFRFSVTSQGPLFQNFSKPLVLSEGKGLEAALYAASRYVPATHRINLIHLRYGYYKVAGKN